MIIDDTNLVNIDIDKEILKNKVDTV